MHSDQGGDGWDGEWVGELNGGEGGGFTCLRKSFDARPRISFEHEQPSWYSSCEK